MMKESPHCGHGLYKIVAYDVILYLDDTYMM